MVAGFPGRSVIAARSLAAIVGAMLVFATFAGAAAAAPPIVHENTANFSAQTFKTECVEERGRTTCTQTSLAVFATDGTAQTCLSIVTYEINRQGEFTTTGVKTGCGTVPSGNFVMDTKNLTSATLASTTITLQILSCNQNGCQPTDKTEEATVAATFTGTGAVSTFRSNGKQEFGNCTYYFGGKGSSRAADASVSINGEPLDPPAMLFASTSKFKVICR
jgi:hypothetical protein